MKILKTNFNEIEQASFSPSNIVPGIGFSPDKMLQARIFSYPDAHRYRVGTHYESLPVNRPLSEVNTYHLAGSMNYEQKEPTDAYYEPNSFGGPIENQVLKEADLKLYGDANRYDHNVNNDNYSQVRDLLNLMNDNQKEQLFNNIAESMAGVPDEIIQRQLNHFEKVSLEYSLGVKKALKM